MKIVSERSAEEVEADRVARARELASERFEAALVDLTVNILRVTRGAGRAHEIARQANALTIVAQEHWDAFGHYPAPEAYHRALRFRQDRDPDYGTDQWRTDALEQIMRGSLQVVASRLAEQPTQVAAGEDEVWRGLRYYAAWQEEVRRERAEAERLSRAATRASRKKPAPRKK